MAKEERNLSHVTTESIDELEALKGLWQTHGDKISMLIIAILATVIAVQQFGRWSARKDARALADYDRARTPEALEELINQNASKVVTPLARLRLAGVFFQQEKYALAESVYETFLKETPTHEFADIAKVGLAHALEANGLVQEAAEKFKAFTEAQPDSFLVPMATIGLGRTLILAGRRDEGKAVLDLFITETAGTRWAAFADEILRSKDRLTVPEVPGTADFSSFFPMEGSEPEAIVGEPEAEVEMAPATEEPAVENQAVEEPVVDEPAVEAPESTDQIDLPEAAAE